MKVQGDEGRDLALTTDYRDVLGRVLAGHLGTRSLDVVFPGYSVDDKRFRELLRSAS